MMYWRIAGVWDGVFDSIKRCLFCEELGKRVQDSEDIYDEDTANLYGGLYEDIDKLSAHYKTEIFCTGCHREPWHCTCYTEEKEPEFMYWCSILSADENDWLPEGEFDTLKTHYNFRKDSKKCTN
jgi:hypothetical protein